MAARELSQRKQKIATFECMNHCDNEVARVYLRLAHWDLNKAQKLWNEYKAMNNNELHAFFKWYETLKYGDNIEYLYTSIKNNTYWVNVKIQYKAGLSIDISTDYGSDSINLKSIIKEYKNKGRLVLRAANTHLLKIVFDNNYDQRIQNDLEINESVTLPLSEPFYFKQKSKEYLIYAHRNGVYKYDMTTHEMVKIISTQFKFSKEAPACVQNEAGDKLYTFQGNVLYEFHNINDMTVLNNTFYIIGMGQSYDLRQIIVYKVFIIKNEFHLFCLNEGIEKTIHIKMDMEQKTPKKIIGIKHAVKNMRFIPKLLKIFYVKKLNKLFAIDPYIGSYNEKTQIYKKKLYSCDIGNNCKWSMRKLELKDTFNIGSFECNECIVCYEVIMILFSNLGIFVIDLERMNVFNINKQSFVPQLIIHPHKAMIMPRYPGKIDCVVNNEENMIYGLHFGLYKGHLVYDHIERLRTQFFRFKMELMQLLPNEILMKAELIINGYCKQGLDDMIIPNELINCILVFYLGHKHI